MRQAFALDEELAFLGERTIRNHVAHMDERVHSWMAQSTNRNIVRHWIGPRGMFGGGGITSGDIIEHYIPDEYVYIFRGDEIDLGRLLQATTKIYAMACRIDDNMAWSPEFKSYFRTAP